MFRVSRPIDVVVLNCWVTATNVTPCAIEQLDELGEVHQRAASAGRPCRRLRYRSGPGDVGKQPLQSRALQRAAGVSAIVIGGLDHAPSLARWLPMNASHASRCA